jgi:hypothetical protein
MIIDLHVHTRHSPCGVGSPDAIIRRAGKRGLSGIAVTDHNTTAGIAEVRAAAPPGFIVIPGVEYATDHGHILALFCETFAVGLKRDEMGRFALAELSPFIRARGGILVAAHPRALPPPAFIDGLESANSRELSRNAGSRTRIEAAAAENGLIATGGSDAHIPIEVGRCCTRFPPDTPNDLPSLREALLQGRCAAEGTAGSAAYRIVSKLIRKVRNAG